jgi:SAM-dependent methyltransferase
MLSSNERNWALLRRLSNRTIAVPQISGMRKLHGAELKEYFKDPDGAPSLWRPEQGDFQFWHQQELKILDQYFPIEGSPLVLDAACGQARFARYFAGKRCRVQALDVNARMLEPARAPARPIETAPPLPVVSYLFEHFAFF